MAFIRDWISRCPYFYSPARVAAVQKSDHFNSVASLRSFGALKTTHRVDFLLMRRVAPFRSTCLFESLLAK